MSKDAILASLIAKLQATSDLSDDEQESLRALPIQVREVRKGHDIVRQGDTPSQCTVLLDGFASRYKFTSAGRRQIFCFHIAGDLPDLQSLHLAVMDHNIGTLTDCVVGFIPHGDIRSVLAAHPRLAAACWRETLIDAAVFREWMLGIGRRSAYERIAHLLCEVLTRLASVGQTEGLATRFPISQEMISDALGLSSVHVNRVVQALRADGLITLGNGVLVAEDWEGLKAAGDFDSGYLHLKKAPLS